MATIKKSAKKYATGGTVTTETTKPVKKTFKTNPDSGGVVPFTDKEQTERRKRLNLPTSDKEKKAYYDKMAKEGAKNGKTIKKAQVGMSMSPAKVKSVQQKINDNNRQINMSNAASSIKKNMAGTAKSGGKMKKCKGGC